MFCVYIIIYIKKSCLLHHMTTFPLTFRSPSPSLRPTPGSCNVMYPRRRNIERSHACHLKKAFASNMTPPQRKQQRHVMPICFLKKMSACLSHWIFFPGNSPLWWWYGLEVILVEPNDFRKFQGWSVKLPWKVNKINFSRFSQQILATDCRKKSWFWKG